MITIEFINNLMISLKYKKTKKGSGLVMALVMIVVVSIILTSLLGYISSQISYSRDRVERERAFQIAEAGAYYYRWYLAHQIQGRTAQQIADFWGTDNVATGDPLGVFRKYTAEFKDPDGNAIGQYELEVTPPSAGSTIVTAKSTGWTNKKPSAKRTVQVRFRRPSWSEYIFLSDSYMNFGDQSTVYGKIHSNTGIRFTGKAYNTVSARPSSFDDPNYGGPALDFGVYTATDNHAPSGEASTWPPGTVPNWPLIFMGGREFPTPEVNFSGVSTDLDSMKDQAEHGNGQYYDNEGIGRKITLKSGGTYDICTVSSATNNSRAITGFSGFVIGATSGNGAPCTTNVCCSSTSCPYISNGHHNQGRCESLLPTRKDVNIVDNGVIFVDDNIWVEGPINNKRIAIVAGGTNADIYIGLGGVANDLRYASYDCNNKIGLVAQRNVLILNSCPNAFTVDAALLAQNGIVGINDNGFSSKTSLTFNGAIASRQQPFFQHGNSGFAVRFYNFDNDLLYCPPPYFPTGTEYSIDLWDEL